MKRKITRIKMKMVLGKKSQANKKKETNNKGTRNKEMMKRMKKKTVKW